MSFSPPHGFAPARQSRRRGSDGCRGPFPPPSRRFSLSLPCPPCPGAVITVSIAFCPHLGREEVRERVFPPRSARVAPSSAEADHSLPPSPDGPFNGLFYLELVFPTNGSEMQTLLPRFLSLFPAGFHQGSSDGGGASQPEGGGCQLRPQTGGELADIKGVCVCGQWPDSGRGSCVGSRGLSSWADWHGGRGSQAPNLPGAPPPQWVCSTHPPWEPQWGLPELCK